MNVSLNMSVSCDIRHFVNSSHGTRYVMLNALTAAIQLYTIAHDAL